MYNILWIILLCVFIYFVYVSSLKKETFDSVLSQKDSENAKLILEFFKKSKQNIDFVDYVNFLLSIKNTNLKIINQDTFHEFKVLNKINRLSLKDIETMMKNKS